MMNKEELEALAVKFGSIPNKVNDVKLTRKDLLVPKYLTEEEFENLKFCPRVGEVTSRSSWPTIGGRTTYPMSGILNETEKKALNAYVAAERSGNGGAKQKPVDSQESIDAWQNIVDHLVEVKDNATLALVLQHPALPEAVRSAIVMRVLKMMA